MRPVEEDEERGRKNKSEREKYCWAFAISSPIHLFAICSRINWSAYPIRLTDSLLIDDGAMMDDWLTEKTMENN